MDTEDTNVTLEDIEGLKGLSRADTLVPKLPLIDPTTGKRQDGRGPSDIRPIYVQTGVRGGSRGSSYIEVGNTKVICVVNGPKDLSKKIDYSKTGILSVEVQSIGSKTQEKDVILLKEALEAIVLLEKFPKSLLEIFITILEDAGSSVAASLTAAGLALIDAGVPVYDTPVGGSLLFDGDKFYLDPTKAELQVLDLTDSLKNEKGGGIITMGYLPTREEICLFTMEGKVESETLTKCMESLKNMNLKMFSVIRNHSMERIESSKDPSRPGS